MRRVLIYAVLFWATLALADPATPTGCWLLAPDSANEQCNDHGDWGCYPTRVALWVNPDGEHVAGVRIATTWLGEPPTDALVCSLAGWNEMAFCSGGAWLCQSEVYSYRLEDGIWVDCGGLDQEGYVLSLNLYPLICGPVTLLTTAEYKSDRLLPWQPLTVAPLVVPIVCHDRPPTLLVGDCNDDGVVNTFDIDPFIDALLAGLTCADVNGDGMVNAFDIDPFIELLTGGK